MSEKKAIIRNEIDSELRRVQIQNHPNFSAWYASLKPYAQQVFDLILEDEVTPELISLAQDAPDDEWEEFQFLRVIGGGNLDQSVMPILTNFSLFDIFYHVEHFKG